MNHFSGKFTHFMNHFLIDFTHFMKSEAKKTPNFWQGVSNLNIMNSFFVVFSYLRLVLNASRLIDVFCYLLFNTFRLALRHAQCAATFLLFSSKSPIISFFFFGYSRCTLLFPPPTSVFPLPY